MLARGPAVAAGRRARRAAFLGAPHIGFPWGAAYRLSLGAPAYRLSIGRRLSAFQLGAAYRRLAAAAAAAARWVPGGAAVCCRLASTFAPAGGVTAEERMLLHDSRRLTGPNLLLDHAGAVIDAYLSPGEGEAATRRL